MWSCDCSELTEFIFCEAVMRFVCAGFSRSLSSLDFVAVLTPSLLGSVGSTVKLSI